MKISSIIWFTLLIVPIVLIFPRPFFLAGQKGYGKVMQALMALCRFGWSDAGPWMA